MYYYWKDYCKEKKVEPGGGDIALLTMSYMQAITYHVTHIYFTKQLNPLNSI